MVIITAEFELRLWLQRKAKQQTILILGMRYKFLKSVKFFRINVRYIYTDQYAPEGMNVLRLKVS